MNPVSHFLQTRSVLSAGFKIHSANQSVRWSVVWMVVCKLSNMELFSYGPRLKKWNKKKKKKTELTVSLCYPSRIELHWHKHRRLPLSPSLTLLTLWIILTPQKKSLSSWPQTLCLSAHAYNIFLQPRGCFFFFSPPSPFSLFSPSSSSSLSPSPFLQWDPEPTRLEEEKKKKKRQDLLVGAGSECQNQHRSSPRGDLQQIGPELDFFFFFFFFAVARTCVRLPASTAGAPAVKPETLVSVFVFKKQQQPTSKVV